MNIPANLRKSEYTSFVCLNPCATPSAYSLLPGSKDFGGLERCILCGERPNMALIPASWVTLGHANMAWILWLCS